MPNATTHEGELLNTAFALYSNPGAYALLLGAGVSAPSGVPTAWGVLEDLAASTAELLGAATDDPIAWYEGQFGEHPTYEGVLERLAPTQIERQRLLRGYFAQSPEDIDAGRKGPTPAHRAIAKLVRAGAVKVIVTLNFDHLIEDALRAEGLEPTIVASPADIDGMAPLHTLDCCVIHLHGDYLNPTTMLNTVTELKSYDPNTVRLLHRILEDYGLIIAGWSSKYDPALREVIASHYPNRFTLTWFEPAEPSEEATVLRTLKKGTHVAQTADEGFGQLADAVVALARRRARHPLAIPVVVETAKRGLAGETVSIGLHDRLRHELDVLHQLPEFHLDNHDSSGDYETMLTRVEEATRLPAALLATLAYWGDDETDRWWVDELPRLATSIEGSGLVKLLTIRVVSGSILFYAAGVAAVAAQRFDLLGRLFALRRPNRYNGQFETLASSVDAEAGYEGASSIHTRLFNLLRPLLLDSLSLGGESLEDAWQRFEILRLTWATQHAPNFHALQADYENKDGALQTAKKQFEDLELRSGADTSAAQAARTTALHERDRLLGQVCQLVSVGRPHILTVDVSGADCDERYQSATAIRLLHDLEAEGAAHAFVRSGLLDDAASAVLAMRSVSMRLGMIGRELSWQRVSDVAGVVPTQMWIDSGQTPYERAAALVEAKSN